jgi:hypothetical protein
MSCIVTISDDQPLFRRGLRAIFLTFKPSLSARKEFDDEFLLLACDGLWDVIDAEDAVRVTRDLLFEKKWLQEGCRTTGGACYSSGVVGQHYRGSFFLIVENC